MILSSLIIIIIAIMFSALFSGMETGSYTVNKIRLHHKIEQKERSAERLSRNLKDPQQFIFSLLVGNNITIYVATATLTTLFTNLEVTGSEMTFIYGILPWSAEIAATLALMLPLFMFAEVGPKNLFRVKADTLMYQTSYFQKVLLFICLPATLPLKMLARFLTNSGGKDLSYGLKNITLHRLNYFLQQGRKEGAINARQNEMISNTLMLQKRKVSEIMIPINETIKISLADLTIENCMIIFKQRKINHILVYDRSQSNIIGFVDIFDIIGSSINNMTLKDSIKQLFPLDSSNDIQQSFYQLQSNEEIVGLVNNTEGTPIGIVRLKDIIRNITGN